MKADLHIHTTESDGTETPERVVQMAGDAGFSVISVTDHDTLAGVPKAIALGQRSGVRVIPGCEVSTGIDLEIHMLAYGLKPGCALEKVLLEMKQERYDRMLRMLRKLDDLGMHVEFDQVQSYTNGPLGRAHLARALVENGYVPSVREVFSRYLSRGGSAYVARRKLATCDVIRLIRDCGGVPVVAHPGSNCVDTFHLEECLQEWKRAGLMGMEAHHPAHGASLCSAIDRMARRNHLLVTGGSDYHGSIKLQNIGDGMTNWKYMEQDTAQLIEAINNESQH